MAITGKTKHQWSLFQTNRSGITRQKVKKSCRKVPSVRLGGKGRKRGIVVMIRVLRRIKLRWMKLRRGCTLKRLKDYYYSVIHELMEAGATFQIVMHRIMTESHRGVPMIGIPAVAIAIPSV